MFATLVAARLLSLALTESCAAGSSAPALDHVVVVVRDLDSTAARFERLGFRTKAGRLHANRLLNRHVKFRDGSGIELMTVRGEPRDDMARDYSRLLRLGEGGAAVGLTVPSLSDVERATKAVSLEARRSSSGSWKFLGFPPSTSAAAVFFASGDFRVRDPDSVLSHVPAVLGLREAWVEGGDPLNALLGALGAGRCETVRAPDGRVGQRWALSRGSVVVLPSPGPGPPRVVGVVLATSDTATATLRPLPSFWVRFQPEERPDGRSGADARGAAPRPSHGQ